MYKWSKVIQDIQSAKIAQNQDGRSIHGIMKAMCPPRYDFVATHALIAMMLMSCSCNSASAAGTGIGYEGCSGIVPLSPSSSVDFNVKSFCFLIIFFQIFVEITKMVFFL